jgi:hypothetical protein
MVQMIPNAALIQGAINAIEKYTPQQGFFVLAVQASMANEKDGIKFLGDDLASKEIKILVSGDLQKKLQLKKATIITGEIKKVNSFLWRAAEDTFRVVKQEKKATKKSVKK